MPKLFAVAVALLLLTNREPAAAFSAAPASRGACTAGNSIELHATYLNYDKVIITADESHIEESFGSSVRDYGFVVGADANAAWIVDENGVERENPEGLHVQLEALRSVICGDAAGGDIPDRRNPNYSHVAYRDSDVSHVITIGKKESLRDGSFVPSAWKIDDQGWVVVSSAQSIAGPIRQLGLPKPIEARVRVGAIPVRKRYGWFELDGSLDGTDVGCIIDTGTTAFAVSSDLAGKIGARNWSSQEVRLVGTGVVMTRVGRVRLLDVAGSRFVRPVVYVDPALPPRTVLCGQDYLSRVRLRIDIPSAQGTVASGSGYSCHPGCVAIGSSGVAYGEATIGQRRLSAFFDTGYGGGVRIPPGVLATIKYSRDTVTASYCHTLSGETEISIDGVTTTTSVCSGSLDASQSITVGALTFAAFRSVVIDYPDHLLQFIK